MVTIHSPCAFWRASSAMRFWMSRIERTRPSDGKTVLSPSRSMCAWLSIRPGITVFPRRSMVRVDGAVNAAIAAFGPTAAMRSAATAIASAIAELRSSVMILPLRKTTSAGRFWPNAVVMVAPAAALRIARRRIAILSGRGGEAFVNELLHAVALRLTGDDISLRIDVEAVQMEKLARLAPGPADVADFFERLAIQNRDALVRAVRNVDETLVRIGRQRNAECGACPLRFTLDDSFLQEFALEGKGLDAIVRTIRYIHDAIFGDLNTVRRVELLRSRTRCLARLGGLVIRLVAVGTPMALVGTGVGVEYDDAAVAVTIGNKYLVGPFVYADTRRPAQMRCIVA